MVRESTVQLAVVLGIIVAGLILTKLISTLLVSIYRKSARRKQQLIDINKEKFIRRVTMYTLLIFTLLASLVYLRVSVVQNLFFSIYDSLPSVLAFVLTLIFGILLVELMVFVIRTFSRTSGLTDIIEEYDKQAAYRITLTLIRAFLYIIMFVTVLDIFQIQAVLLKSFISVVLYGAVIVLALLVFYGLKGFAVDLAAGYYLRNSKMFRPGKRIKCGKTKGEIQNVKRVSTLVKTDGQIMHLSNRYLLREPVLFEKTKSEIEKLEDIRSYFVAQDKSYCGPASLSMALAIFGYNYDQEKIGKIAHTKTGKGTHPDALIKATHQLTEGKVKAVWVSVEKISHLQEELKSWLAAGALVMVDYKKSYVFPTASTAHYSLCLGVKGDELLILDPSGKAGGVYLVNYRKIYKGMDTHSELIKGKRGYLVLAPQGTTAYWRINQGLVYSDVNLYEKLSKRIENTLVKLQEKTKFLDSVIPKSVSNFLNQTKGKEKVARLWKPQKKK